MNDVNLEFPVSDPHGLEGLEETHNLVQCKPFDDPSIAYSLILPKSWISEEDMGEQPGAVGQLARIGLFTEKIAPDAAVVQVSFTRMPFEVGLRDWLQYQAEKFNVRLTYCEDMRFACGTVVDAGGIAGAGEQSHVVRIAAFAENARIFHVMGMIRVDRYEEKKRDLAIATNSFSLLNPGGTEQLEQCHAIQGGDPAFQVGHPASWESRPVRETVPGKSGVDIVLPKDEQMAAYIRVKAISADSAGEQTTEQILQIAEEELQEAHVQASVPWKQDSDPVIKQILGVTETYITAGKLGEQEVELRVGIARREALTFVVQLISAPRAASVPLWLRSKRAYEIALATAAPLDNE